MVRWLVAIALVFASPAAAHDAWIDGTPVPDWVMQFCCSKSDAHHYKFDEVKVTPEGYKFPDYPKVIPADHRNVYPSQDGEWWAFFRKYDDEQVGEMWCVFVPPGSS